jgi:hypothetical protein
MWGLLRACLKSIHCHPHGSCWLQLRWIFRRRTPATAAKSASFRPTITRWVFTAMKSPRTPTHPAQMSIQGKIRNVPFLRQGDVAQNTHMKSPRAGAHPAQMSIQGKIRNVPFLRQGDVAQNTHMKSPRAGAHPAQMSIQGKIRNVPFLRQGDVAQNTHMKSTRAVAHPARMIIGDSIWQIKKAGFSLRTEHMKRSKVWDGLMDMQTKLNSTRP